MTTAGEPVTEVVTDDDVRAEQEKVATLRAEINAVQAAVARKQTDDSRVQAMRILKHEEANLQVALDAARAAASKAGVEESEYAAAAVDSTAGVVGDSTDPAFDPSAQYVQAPDFSHEVIQTVSGDPTALAPANNDAQILATQAGVPVVTVPVTDASVVPPVPATDPPVATAVPSSSASVAATPPDTAAPVTPVVTEDSSTPTATTKASPTSWSSPSTTN